MIKNLLKTTLLTLTITTTLFSIPALADTNNGWNYNSNIKTWNYYVNGKLVKDGVVAYENKLYYLDSLGDLQNGWFTKAGSTVYFQDGLLTTGWMQINNNNWYYFNELGAMQTGIQTINGIEYKFADDGHWIG